MAGKTAGPERSGGMASRGKKPGSPDRASPAGQAEPGDSAGRRDKATSADEVQSQFREALERKRASAWRNWGCTSSAEMSLSGRPSVSPGSAWPAGLA